MAELSAELQAKVDVAIEVLKKIESEFSPAAFANSFGAEDMVIFDLIDKSAKGIEVFSLDTGRLNGETYELMHQAQAQYEQPINFYFPKSEGTQEFLRKNGPNAFYESVEMRKECCFVRKVEPLRRAISGKKAWITGLRAEQSPTRTDLAVQEYDEGNGLEKFNPLLDWTEQDVWDYIKANEVPYNKLHDQNYPSIGCAPCTRAISKGEDIRAGRWWWENPESKECGLHVTHAK